MSYVGTPPVYQSHLTQRISTNGAAFYPLNYNPGSSSAILAVYNGTILRADIDYTVQQSRIVPLGTPWPSGMVNNLFLIYLGLRTSIPMPSENSIGFDELQANVVSSFVQNSVIDTGSANALSVTTSPAWTSYTNGRGLVVTKAGTDASSGSVTISVDGLSPVPIFDFNGAALYPYALRSNQTFVMVYNTSSGGFRLLNVAAANDTSLVGYFPLSTAPAGWLAADGSSVSRTSYAALFSRIGTLFGAGNGTTTFTLPDFRGEFIRGWDNGRGIDPGRALGSYQADEFRSHTHTSSQVGGGGNLGGGSSFTNTPTVTGAAGGAETRPRNYSLLTCIRYI